MKLNNDQSISIHGTKGGNSKLYVTLNKPPFTGISFIVNIIKNSKKQRIHKNSDMKHRIRNKCSFVYKLNDIGMKTYHTLALTCASKICLIV
jgi:hypothetical protein